MDGKRVAMLALSMSAAAIPVMGYALSIPLRICYEKVTFKNLPSYLRGLKILHIADLHGRSPHKMNFNIWPAINQLNVDMAVLTGDVVLDKANQIYPHLEGLKALCKKVPVFYVDGNHENECYNEMADLLSGIGVTVLYNRQGDFAVGSVESGASKVVSVTGFRDYEYLSRNKFKGVSPLLDNMSAKGGFHVVLTHQPQIFDWLCKTNASSINSNFSALVLAGHTHGGQIRLPFFPTLYAPGQGVLPKYGDGWYEESDGQLKLFISRGVGATHFWLRTFNPSEVAVIELQKD
ncbi:MAG: metallophosphoesterase [Defluviitaleaceae bacterium]|nr:metallophosphoesterase [Defluviitaleaceae bacterium]